MVRAAQLAAVLSVASLSAAGCGGGGDQQAVRDTLTRLESATATHDYKTLCERVFTAQLIERLLERGLPCERALAIGLGNVRQPHLDVQRVTVKGKVAVAVVRSTAEGEQPATDVVQLIKQADGWRVSKEAPTRPAAPTKP